MSKNNGKIKPDQDQEPRIITEDWFRFINFVENYFPNGILKVKIVNSRPVDLEDWKLKIRFDKDLPEKFSPAMLLSPKQNKT